MEPFRDVEGIGKSYSELCSLVGSTQLPDEETISKFRDLVEGAGRIITVGAGRSGEIADVFMRFLRNLGYERSYGPDDVPYIIKYSDLVIGFTGSGTTTYTLQTLQVAKDAGARTVVFTATPESPAAALADLVMNVPGGTKSSEFSEDYYERLLSREMYAPLTPLGTLFELRALFISLAFIRELAVGGSLGDNYGNLLDVATEYEPSGEEFDRLYSLMPRPRSRENPWPGKVVVIGEGFSGSVAKFFVTRLRHVAKADEVREVYYWLDKGSVAVSSGDLVIIISGSGEQLPAILAAKARSKGVRVAGITSFPTSSLGLNSDVIVRVPGRKVQRIRGLRSSYLPRDPIDSAFELRALLSLEALVHEIAKVEGVTEADMRKLHSDFT
ncbi:MAG: SIS domain-containing protein [Conexivisphaera sp.]|jgi:6-phospho-3-hexuloisomerase